MANTHKNTVYLRKNYWNFFNKGRRYQFDPNKRTVDIDNNPTNFGEVHRDIVKSANSADIFLLNELGEQVV